MKMDIKTLRWHKTRKLVNEAGGISRFAEKIGRSQQQANRFAGPNPVTGIGNKIARLIEESFDLEKNSLDKHDDQSSIDLSVPADNVAEALRKANMASLDHAKALKNWQIARPHAIYMVRSELRTKLIDCGIEIISENDSEFILGHPEQQIRLGLLVPIEGHKSYQYNMIKLANRKPDFLAISSYQEPELVFISCLRIFLIHFQTTRLSL